MREYRELRDSAGVLAVAPAEAARLLVGAQSFALGKRRLITIESLRAWLLAHEVSA